MMAAGRAAELGARVVLLEKKSRLGIKLLATGGGRANITNQRDARSMANSFGYNGRWLLSGLSKFGPEDTIAFFNQLGLKTKVESDGRVFPRSNSATDVWQILINYLETGKVDIKPEAIVKKLVRVGDRIEKIILTDNSEIIADKFIICTGGRSYPQTGSTGDGYKWLKQLGHQIITPRPALTPVIVLDKFVKNLEGVSLEEAGISVYQKNKKVCTASGPLLFTANGLSGPTILNLSEIIGRTDLKDLQIRIDFLPGFAASELDQKLQKDFGTSQKIFKNYLEQLLSPKLASIVTILSGVDQFKKINSINRDERRRLLSLLKEFTLSIWGLAGYDRAMITAGGVDLQQVDSRSMRSKIISNLYLAGEVLDLNGPTGGYNLQLCWTSGYLAGEAAANDQR